MRSGRNVTWLGLTPEPERELPAAVVTLRRRAVAPPPSAGMSREAPEGGWVAAERRRVEGLILHGTQRDWLRYLAEVTDLVTAAAGLDGEHRADREVRAAALRAAETVLDHHRMLIGLPGPAYERVAAGRAELTRAIAALRDRPARPP